MTQARDAVALLSGLLALLIPLLTPLVAEAHPLPPARLIGALSVDGQSLDAEAAAAAGHVVQVFAAGGVPGSATPLGSYAMGEDSALGDLYRVDISLDSEGPVGPGAAVDLYVGAQRVTAGHVLTSGALQRLDLDLLEDSPPVLSPIGPLTVAEGETLALVLSGEDPDGDAITFSAEGLPGGASLGSEDGILLYEPGFEDAGVYAVVFTARARNLTDSEAVTLTVGNTDRPPELDPIPPQTLAEGEPFTLTMTASDPDGDAILFSADALPEGATLDPESGVFAFTPTFEQAASYGITVSATAGGLVDSALFELLVIDVDRPPSISAPPSAEIAEGATLSFVVEASDPDGDPLSLEASGLPTGASFDGETGALTFTPGFDQAGGYTLVFTATARGETASAETQLTVLGVDRPPVFTAIGPQSVQVGETLTFTVAATDPDGDDVTLSSDALPEGASFEAQTGAFAFAPSEAQSGQTLSAHFSASAGGASTTLIVAITVGAPNGAPVIAPIPDVTLSIGEDWSLVVSASDPDDDALILSAEGLPLGASFDPATGRLSWTPVEGDGGVYPLTIRASDGELEGSETFTVTVEESAEDGPRVAAIGAPRILAFKGLEFVLRGEDPEGARISYAIEGAGSESLKILQGGRVRVSPSGLGYGENPFTLRASAGGRETSLDFSIEVVRPLVEGTARGVVERLVCPAPLAVGAPATDSVTLLCPERSDVPIATLTGVAGSGFGGALAFVDHDLDGLWELAVGAPGEEGGAGAVYLFDGKSFLLGASLNHGEALFRWAGEEGSALGAALASHPSVPEVLFMGAPGRGDGVGGVWVVSASVPAAPGQWASCGGTATACGESLALFGGEGGEPLLAIGAPGGSLGAVAIHADLAGDLRLPTSELLGSVDGGRFGQALALGGEAGDLVLAVGVPGADQVLTFGEQTLRAAQSSVGAEVALWSRSAVGLGESIHIGALDGAGWLLAAGRPRCGAGCPGEAWAWGLDGIRAGSAELALNASGALSGEAFGAALATRGQALWVGGPEPGSGRPGAVYQIELGGDAGSDVRAVTTGLVPEATYGSVIVAAPAGR